MDALRKLVLSVLMVGSCTLAAPPRLVVVLVFDQMRGDYLWRWSSVWESGFRDLLTEGAVYSNCFFQHAATVTCAGHATLATGTAPERHGISGNSLIPDCCQRRLIGCAEDTLQRISVVWLQLPTLGDYLRQAFPEARVVSLSHKARAALMMGGHSPTAVLWLDPEQEGLVSSPQPPWLAEWNRRHSPRRFAGQLWEATLPAALSPPDSVPWEAPFPKGTCFFPHRIPTDGAAFWDGFLLSPFSLHWLFEAARAAVLNERLGADSIPDILWLSISTTDFVGHYFGPDSREILELYRHCDRAVGDFLEFLDSIVGRSRYVLVLTSDHGVAPIPEMLARQGPEAYPGIDAGRIALEDLTAYLHRRLLEAFGPWSERTWFQLDPPLLLLRPEPIAAAGVPFEQVRDSLCQWLSQYRGLGLVLPSATLWGTAPLCSGGPDSLYLLSLLQRTFPVGRAGDVLFYPKPFWVIGTEVPTTHGTPYEYDRFVPLVLFGGPIPALHSHQPVSPEDIAPTLGALLGVSMPTATGTPLIPTGSQHTH